MSPRIFLKNCGVQPRPKREQTWQEWMRSTLEPFPPTDLDLSGWVQELPPPRPVGIVLVGPAAELLRYVPR